jgi:HSP20 family molecular chaperone IbpA
MRWLERHFEWLEPVEELLDELNLDHRWQGTEPRALVRIEVNSDVDRFPRVDIAETEKAYYLRAEVPGFDKKNLEVLYEDGALILRGRREPESEKVQRLLSERFYGSFERRFRLPEEVRVEKLKARYRDGILTVEIPKIRKKSKEIRIEV